MRSMTVFNYLLEATLFGSVLILLLVAARLLLRQHLGSRILYGLWLIVALRLLLPIALPNPIMDSLRPVLSADVGARPVAAQVRQRLIDTGYHVSALLPGEGGRSLARAALHIRQGDTGRWWLMAWLMIALLVGAWLLIRRSRFHARVRRNRVRPLNESEAELYAALCQRYRVRKAPPVYYVDHLPASCLTGGRKPFIGVPLDTPETHLSLLLSHQLCHWKAGDLCWGVARCLCCAVHWFNPLVWMAAWLSFRDSEMACDDRVTARLHDMDRLAYANVIVSADERENAANMTVSMGASFTDRHIRQRVTAIIRCVRGSRWGVAISSMAAAAVLVFSFATGESEPLPTISAVPAIAWVEAGESIGSDMEAIAAARRFMESPFIGEDSAHYSFTARQSGGEWAISARCAEHGHNVFLRLSREGSLLEYDATSLLDDLTFTDNRYTHRKLTDSVQRYVDAFAATYLPDLTYHVAYASADVREEDTRLLMGVLCLSSGETVGEFTLQIEPEAKWRSFVRVDKSL